MKIGLGVGLGVPLVALLPGGSVWIFLRRKKAKEHIRHAELSGNCTDSPSDYSGSSPPSARYNVAQYQSLRDRLGQKSSELSNHDYRLEDLARGNRQELGSHQRSRFELA